jgi:hypothetical protein
VAVRGEAARRLCRELLRFLEPDVPNGVRIEIRGRGRNCSIHARGLPPPDQTITPTDPAYARIARGVKVRDGRDLHLVGGGSFNVTGGWLGIGPWVPFLPRGLAAKLTAVDALERLQGTIASAVHDPWPGIGYEVRAEVTDDAVRLWFEGVDGARKDVGSVSLAMCGG